MSSRKRPVQEEPLNEAQSGLYAELVEMGFEEDHGERTVT